MKLIKEFKQFLFEAKRGKHGVDWDTYFVLFPYTKDDHDRYKSSMAKRFREGEESLTDEDHHAENKYNAAHRRNLIPPKFLLGRIDWETYFKENTFTPEDKKRYNSAVYKRSSEGSESLTDEDRFAINKYLADLKRRKLKNKKNETN
jgi:hypothetical protein